MNAIVKFAGRNVLALQVFLLALGSLSLQGCAEERGSQMLDHPPQELPAIATVDLPGQTVATASTPPAPEPDTTQAQLEKLLGAYDLNSQVSHLSELASDSYEGRRSGSEGARAAAAYIGERFSELGLQPWQELGLETYAHHFLGDTFEDDNIIGVLPGTGGGYVILGAHYDHLGVDSRGRVYNGADDNAAGVSVLLEAARIFRETGIRPSKSIVFCAFSGEEQGQFGASALAGLISSQGLSGSVELINIDGIGATGGEYFGVWDEGATNTGPLVASLRQAGDFLQTPVVEEGTDIGSDAQAFVWEQGIAAVTVDWHWGQDESLFHPYYHTVDDDVEHIDRGVLERASRISIAGLWLRANQPASQ